MFWRASPRVRRIMEDVIIIAVAMTLFFSGFNAFRGSVTDQEFCERTAKSRQETRDLILDVEQRRIDTLRIFLVRIGATKETVLIYSASNVEYLHQLEERLDRAYPKPNC